MGCGVTKEQTSPSNSTDPLHPTNNSLKSPNSLVPPSQSVKLSQAKSDSRRSLKENIFDEIGVNNLKAVESFLEKSEVSIFILGSYKLNYYQGDRDDVKQLFNRVNMLHLASERGYLEIMKLLLNKGMGTDTTCVPDGNNRSLQLSPLHLAVYNGRIQAAKLLIEAGAKVNLPETEPGVSFHLI